MSSCRTVGQPVLQLRFDKFRVLSNKVGVRHDRKQTLWTFSGVTGVGQNTVRCQKGEVTKKFVSDVVCLDFGERYEIILREYLDPAPIPRLATSKRIRGFAFRVAENLENSFQGHRSRHLWAKGIFTKVIWRLFWLVDYPWTKAVKAFNFNFGIIARAWLPLVL